MTDVIFWTAIGLIIYTYFGYPLVLVICTAFSKNPIRRGMAYPEITFIITVHNEERRLRDKIENTLSLSYPPEQMEIIVASDGSTDETEKIALSYRERGVILVASPQRNGKEYAQWNAIKTSKGTILVFSDVATKLEKDALLSITSNFHDPTIGCVSSEDQIVTDSGMGGGEAAYVRYEMLLRRLESRVHSVAGLSGSFFAVRRELCQEWPRTLPSDFVIVIHAIKHGYRAISDPTAIGLYKTVNSEKEEYQRKIRTVMRGIAVLMTYADVINPMKYGFFAIQFVSHKVLRWLVPFFLLAAFFSNILLIPNSILYRIAFAAQLAFYSLAALGFASSRLKERILIKIPVFFIIVNLSIAVAWIRYLSGHRAVLWEPSKR